MSQQALGALGLFLAGSYVREFASLRPLSISPENQTFADPKLQKSRGVLINSHHFIYK